MIRKTFWISKDTDGSCELWLWDHFPYQEFQSDGTFYWTDREGGDDGLVIGGSPIAQMVADDIDPNYPIEVELVIKEQKPTPPVQKINRKRRY